MRQPQTIIGIVCDFDKTLSPHTMHEDTIFPYLGIPQDEFWKAVNSLVKDRYYESELAWMRLLLERQDFQKLSNEDLRNMGLSLIYYPGVPEFFSKLSEIIKTPIYQEFGIELEFYIISSGLREILEGSNIKPYVKTIFGSEYDEGDSGKLLFPKRAIGHTQKTQYLYRINKGYLDLQDDVNDYLPEEERRIPFNNMIYIGDGPTDVPCFSVIGQNGGHTLAVYDPLNQSSFNKCMQLQRSGRVDFIAEANYETNTHLWRWLSYTVLGIANQIILGNNERQKETGIIPAPNH